MLSIYACALLICAASLVAGRAILALLGRRRPAWLSGATGFAALVVVAPLLLRLPGRSTTAAVIVGVALVAAALIVVRDIRETGDPRDWLPGVAAALIVVGLASLPFADQRPRRCARRGRLHQRPRRAALLGGLASARLRAGAERGALRLSDRTAGGGGDRGDGDRGQPGERLQRPPARDPGADRADRARRADDDAAGPPDRDRRDLRPALPGRRLPRPERLQGDGDGALRARLRPCPAGGVAVGQAGRSSAALAVVVAICLLLAAAAVFTFSLPGLAWFAIAVPLWLVLEALAGRSPVDWKARSRAGLAAHRVTLGVAAVIVVGVAAIAFVPAKRLRLQDRRRPAVRRTAGLASVPRRGARDLAGRRLPPRPRGGRRGTVRDRGRPPRGRLRGVGAPPRPARWRCLRC